MNIFTSNRERNLWVWAAATLFAIYASLGFVPRLVGLLDDATLSNAFWVGLFLVMLTILTQGLKARPRGIEIGVGLGIAAVYLLIALRFTIPAERSHLIEYSIVATFIYEAIRERSKHVESIRFPAILAFVITVLLGLFDEIIQIFLPNRVYDNFDVLFNAIAAFMAITGNAILTYVRNWRKNETRHSD